jgi:hypothetical protein
MSSRSIYFGGQKGGSTKTTTSHGVCLGAILCKQPAAYVLTDPNRQLKEEGRPYRGEDTIRVLKHVKRRQRSSGPAFVGV